MNAGWGLWPRISWNPLDLNPHKICQISWNPPDFKIMSFCMMIKYRSFVFRKTNQKRFCWNIWLVFQKKDLYLIITQKLTFMKSSRFHHEIWWISPLNLADFMKSMKSGGFQVKSDVSEISCRCFSKTSSDFTRFGVDFTWNLPDFMKSAGFHLKSAGFLMDFMKSSGFHEIWQISPWNLVDFRWNQIFQKSAADVSAKTLLILQGLGWISPEICWISWNPLDFTWNLPDFMKSTRFHTDFMKSGGFHVKSKDLCKEL